MEALSIVFVRTLLSVMFDLDLEAMSKDYKQEQTM